MCDITTSTNSEDTYKRQWTICIASTPSSFSLSTSLYNVVTVCGSSFLIPQPSDAAVNLSPSVSGFSPLCVRFYYVRTKFSSEPTISIRRVFREQNSLFLCGKRSLYRYARNRLKPGLSPDSPAVRHFLVPSNLIGFPPRPMSKKAGSNGTLNQRPKWH